MCHAARLADGILIWLRMVMKRVVVVLESINEWGSWRCRRDVAFEACWGWRGEDEIFQYRIEIIRRFDLTLATTVTLTPSARAI